MSKEILTEHVMEPQQIEGTTDQVAQGIVDQILWPTIDQLSQQDHGEAEHFCHDLIAGLVGCIAKLNKGDTAKTIAALKEIHAGTAMMIKTLEKSPAKQPLRRS